MPFTRLTAAALFLCLPVIAHATEDSAPPATQTDREADKPKKVCRMETATGSVMPKRVCRTPEQVAADQEAARRTRDELNRGQNGR